MKNFYAILGLSIQATPEEITAAFKKKSLKYHPDKVYNTAEKESAKKEFEEINEAYETLKNPLKKEKYDRLFKIKNMHHNTIREPVAGLLTDPTPPLSSIFKDLHFKTYTQVRMQPLGPLPLQKPDNPFRPFILEGESSDFFHQLRDQASAPPDPFIKLINFQETPLTPAYAFVLLAHFLQGKYVGFNHSNLQKYFETAIKKTKKSSDTTHILNLYQGVLHLLTIVDSDQNRKYIYPSMKKIIDYARYQEPTEDHKPAKSIAEIFQLPAFRQLFSIGMQQQWALSINIPIERFLSSEVDKVLEEDNNGQKSLYLYTLYAAQNDLGNQCKEQALELEKSESEKFKISRLLLPRLYSCN